MKCAPISPTAAGRAADLLERIVEDTKNDRDAAALSEVYTALNLLWRDGVMAIVSEDEEAEITRRLRAHDELLDIARLFERSLVYQIGVDRSNGDDEGANMKLPTLETVRAAIASAEGRADG